MLAATAPLAPIATAVVHPCDAASLIGALEARDKTLITPILVGPEDRIKAVAAEEGLNIDGLEIIDTKHSHASAQAAVRLVREGKARP